jgi:hypothetical protein
MSIANMHIGWYGSTKNIKKDVLLYMYVFNKCLDANKEPLNYTEESRINQHIYQLWHNVLTLKVIGGKKRIKEDVLKVPVQIVNMHREFTERICNIEVKVYGQHGWMSEFIPTVENGNLQRPKLFGEVSLNCTEGDRGEIYIGPAGGKFMLSLENQGDGFTVKLPVR